MTTKDEDNTDNKGLNLPAIGAVTDWASQYRQNFIDIDDALKNVFTDRIAKPIVEAAVIEGDVVDGQQLTKIDGAGLGINAEGELVLTAEFDGIEGLTNPLVEDVNADGFDIENVGNFSSQNATVDGTTSTQALEAGTVSAESLGTNQGTIWDQSENDFIDWWTVASVENTSATTSSSFTDVALGNGLVADFEGKPDGATLYGRLIAQITSNSDTEEADLRPQCRDLNAGDNFDLDELTVSVSNTASEAVDSGWTEITSVASGIVVFRRYQARVESGGEFDAFSSIVPTLAFGWRLD